MTERLGMVILHVLLIGLWVSVIRIEHGGHSTGAAPVFLALCSAVVVGVWVEAARERVRIWKRERWKRQGRPRA